MRETRSAVPNIDVSPAARILTAGTLKGQRRRVSRTSGEARFYALVCIHDGEGDFVSAASDRVRIRRGDLLLLFPGVAHEYGPVDAGAWDESYMTYDGQIFDSLVEANVVSPAAPVRSGLPEVWLDRMLALVDLVIERHHTSGAVLASTVLSLVCEFAATRPARHLTIANRRWIEQVYQMLDRSSPMSLSLEEVARRLGTSYGSLLKRFSRLTGEPLGRARTRLAMERAESLLRSEQLSITQISDQLGFSDPSYFCRSFRQYTGLTPGGYRRMTTGE